MSFFTQAYLLEKYGPRLNISEVAQVLGVAEKTLRNRLSLNKVALRMYEDQGLKCADSRDVADYLDDCRARAPSQV
jgi:DNA-directed RNA polymerase specialized sigma24 family protein